jgi:penicillin-binding protein 2
MTRIQDFENRKFFFYAIAIGVGLVFSWRLFSIQILDDRYKLSAQDNAVRRLTLYPDRGYIYDRNGKLLVSNQPAYDIMVTPREVDDLDTNMLLTDLGLSMEEFVAYWERMRERTGYSYYKPNLLIAQMSREQIASFQERSYEYNGFYVQKRTLRHYPYAAAANVLGYIREASDALVNENSSYRSGDFVGANGIEKSYEEFLRGERGVAYRVVDVYNREHGSFENGIYDTMPIPGFSVTSTLDIELQMYAEQLMSNKRGSVVAIEPGTGEILALVSSPSYDPNLMVGRERNKNYNALYRDSFNMPLFDRSLLAEYPPGSPFKVINGLIALQEGVVTPNTTVYCNHGFHYGNLHVACHSPSGNYNLHNAVMESCNGYFCQVYKDIIEKYPNAEQGMDAWNAHVKSFGLGGYLNNDLYTGRKGFVPDAAYYNRVYKGNSWRAVTTISNGIGQGELLVTPIQLANMTAAIANRGYYYTPHIVKKTNGEQIADSNFVNPKYTTIDERHFDPIIRGMVDVFDRPEGTAFYSRIPGITIGGKTGTAENPHGQDHSIFICFAPVENPKIALAVIVENGYWGSRWAAPISSLLIEKYLTDSISRPAMEERMLEGSIMEEYIQQEERKMEGR